MKSLDLKAQLEEVERQLEEADKFDPACGKAALATFVFSQNLVELWRGSNLAGKRELLEVVSLKKSGRQPHHPSRHALRVHAA